MFPIYPFCIGECSKGDPLSFTGKYSEYGSPIVQKYDGGSFWGISLCTVLPVKPQGEIREQITFAKSGACVILPQDAFVNPDRIQANTYFRPTKKGRWKVQPNKVRPGRRTVGVVLAVDDDGFVKVRLI